MTIQSVERAIQILRLFEDTEKLGVTEISRLLGLHKSTTFGIVNTLAVNKFLEQDPDSGKYKLGIDLFRISSHVQIGIREIGAPHVEQLMESIGETVNLVVRDDIYVVYIEKKESPHSMRICTKIGQRMPMYCTAVGKAIMAFLSRSETEAILARTEIHSYTDRTLRTKEELMAQLDQVRSRGYALDDEELEYGLVCIAVPVLDSNMKPLAAISVSGPKQRMTPENIARIFPLLSSHARQLAKEMF